MFGKMSNIIGTLAFDKSKQKKSFETIWTMAEFNTAITVHNKNILEAKNRHF